MSPKIRKAEDLADNATLAIIAVLGLTMLVGLLTASGTVPW